MTRFTLTVGDREYQLGRIGTLRELVQRKLISPADQVSLPGLDRLLTVDEVLAREEDYASLLTGETHETTAEELWDALRDTGAYPVDDLVSQMMDGAGEGAARAAPGPTARPQPRPLPTFTDIEAAPSSDEIDLRQQIGEVVGREEEIEDLPADAITSVPSIEPIESPVDSTLGAEVTPIESPADPSLGSGEWQAEPVVSDGRVPRSFAQFVQERQVTPGLDISEDRVNLVSGGRTRPLWMWPAIVGIVVAGASLGTCGVVKQGAEQAFPLESEVRAARAGGDTEYVPVPEDDDPTEARTPSPLAVEGNPRELLLRSQIPVPVQPFRNVEAFKDVLFMDLANSGVPAREIRIQALVVAPVSDPERQRPEEVNLELRLAPLEGQAAEDAVLKAYMVIGHYGADAHVRLRRVVIHNRAEDSPGTIYDVQGATVMAFYEGQVDIDAFLLASEVRTGSSYTLELPDEAAD